VVASGLRRAFRAPRAPDLERAEDGDPLAAVVRRPDGGPVFLGARDVRVARDLDLDLAGDATFEIRSQARKK